MLFSLLLGGAEYAAWLAMIYGMASEAFARALYGVTLWAEAFVEKYGG